MIYKDYIRSHRWYRRKKKYFKKFRYECIVCRTKENLELHHLTYEHLGNERDEELCYLCRIHHQAVTDGYFTIERVWFVTPKRRWGSGQKAVGDT